jgi:FkbM family methyltransferase
LERLRELTLRALERLRAGPRLGLTRFRLIRGLHRRLDAVVTRATAPLVKRPVRVAAYGFEFWVDPSDRQVSLDLLRSRRYEPVETDLFERVVRPRMVVVDVGANLGVYTLLAARAVGDAGRVVAIEPNPPMFGLLTRNVLENGMRNVDLVCKAVGSEAGEMSLYRVPGHPALASLSSTNARASTDRIPVEMETLDALLAALEIGHVDLMKVDTQGAELEVLEGAREMIERDRPLLFVEYWPAGLRGMNHDPPELLARLEAWGYALSLVENPDVALSVADVERASEERGVDLVLRPRL